MKAGSKTRGKKYDAQGKILSIEILACQSGGHPRPNAAPTKSVVGLFEAG
jgi:hypothetical protein